MHTVLHHECRRPVCEELYVATPPAPTNAVSPNPSVQVRYALPGAPERAASPGGSWQRQLNKSRCERRRSRVESLLLERSRDSTPSSLTSALALRASQGSRASDRYTAAKEMGRGVGGVGGGGCRGCRFDTCSSQKHTHTHMQLCRHVRIDRDVHTYCLCIRAHVRINIYPPPSAVPLFLSPAVHFRWHIFAFIREGQWTPSTSKIEEKHVFVLGISAKNDT